ncbi:MAG: S8 family serine peptidase [Gemmatimonadota bacterium]
MKGIPRRAAVGLVLALTACSDGPSGPNGSTPDPDFDAGEVLVRLAPSADLAAFNARHGTRTIASVTSERVHLLGLPAGSDVVGILPALRADPALVAAAPNGVLGTPETEAEGRSTMAFADPSLTGSDYSDQNALDRMRVPEAWEASRGAGVVVAVLDTGVDPTHPLLAGRLATGGVDVIDGDTDPSEVADGVDSDGDGLTDEAMGHGTFVAGLVLSVAPEARVLPIRVLDSDGVGTAFQVAVGLEAARRAGARVVNLSLGMTEEADVVEQVIDEMEDEGVVFIASAGNRASDRRQFPAGAGDVIGVAAIDEDDRRAEFSNFGSWVSASAPGVGLVSLLPTGALGTWSGTSFAAALASGEAALLIALAPGARADDIRDAILDSALRLPDPSLNGAGRLDARAAVEWLLDRVGDDS